MSKSKEDKIDVEEMTLGQVLSDFKKMKLSSVAFLLGILISIITLAFSIGRSTNDQEPIQTPPPDKVGTGAHTSADNIKVLLPKALRTKYASLSEESKLVLLSQFHGKDFYEVSFPTNEINEYLGWWDRETKTIIDQGLGDVTTSKNGDDTVYKLMLNEHGKRIRSEIVRILAHLALAE